MVKHFLGSARRFLLNRIDRPALVLLYHRVTKLDSDPQLLAVSPENFYEQVNYLRGNCALLRIEEFYELLVQRKKMPKKAVILTFDDGYADNFLEALPILESLNAQALFYITTSNLDTNRELWWDELERIILKNPSLPGSISIEHNQQPYSFKTESESERTKTYFLLQPLLRFTAPAQRDRIMDQLRASTGTNDSGRPSHRVLTTHELLQLSRSLAAVIGAHTHNHASLAVLPYKEQEQEMRQSKNILEKITGAPVLHFSYPYGSKKDYNRDSVKACAENGFKMVCSNFYSQVHAWTNPLEVPRVLVRDWNKQEFTGYLSKFFSY